MASEKDLNVYILGRTYDILRKPDLQGLTVGEQRELSEGFKLFSKYYEAVFDKPFDHRIDGIESFFELKPYREILELKDYFFKFDIPIIDLKKKKKEEDKDSEEDSEDGGEGSSEEETVQPKTSEETETKVPEKASPPTKEASTVPPEVQALLKSLRDKNTDLESDSTHTVANAVLRARKTWEDRNRIATILKNRTEKQRELDDDFFIETVDPKSESKEAIYRNVESVSRQAVIAQAANLSLGLSQAQIEKAVDDLTYLGISGGVDVTNFHDVNIVSQLAFRNQGITITSPVNDVDNVVQAWQHAIETDPYSDKPDELEKQIDIADKNSEKYFITSTKSFEYKLSQNNLDLDDDIKAASIETRNIQNALLKAVPFTATQEGITPEQAKNLEKVIRSSDTSLHINPEGMGARTAAVIETTNSGNRNVSPEAVRLYAIGLTPDKLDKLSSDPNSELSKFISQNKENLSVYQQVRFHIGKIHDSELGKEIKDGLPPVSGISGQINNIYNRLPPGVQTATKFILNPKGTVYAWANKKIGESIGRTLVKNVGSATAQKLGNFVLQEGLQKGISSFAKAYAEKLALEVAKKVGVTVVGESLVATVAAALSISTAGASLIIGAVIIIGTEIVKATVGKVKQGLDAVWVQLGWGDEFRTRDFVAPVVVGGTVVATAAAGAFATFILVKRATQMAVVSAAGVIFSASLFVGLYVLMAYLVAPILSTLVQLDSKEKVDYSLYMQLASSSGECGWPTAGHYSINTGPRGGTHNRSKLEAIDIGAPGGSAHLSGTDGTVTFTGVFSNYGNTVKVQTKNSAGSFVAIYGHLSSIGVKVGQQVKNGQKIGVVGGSGGWSPHIHMEYTGIQYNQCPAGGLKIKEMCCSYSPAPVCSGPCNAFSN